MLSSMLKAHAVKRGARFLPGGWITMTALSPTGRRVIHRGVRELHKQYRKRADRTA